MYRYLLALLFLFVSADALAADPQPVQIEEMTWIDVVDRAKEGAPVLVPVGGTEQNGPHMAIGKHNVIVSYTTYEIAKQVKGVIAPVIAYVPEGKISPPEGHMKFPGTISVREETFEMLLEDAARSLKQGGFKLICFIGDSGGNQEGQKKVAEKLNREWDKDGVRVLHVSDYYAHNGQKEWAAKAMPGVENPAAHAGFMDASELMVIWPHGVRKDDMRAFTEDDFEMTGAKGDPTLATSAYGKALLQLKIDAAVKQIKAEQARAHQTD